MDFGPLGWRRPWMPAASTAMRSRCSFRRGNRCGPKPSSGRWAHSEGNRRCGASFSSPRGRTTSAFWTDPSNGRLLWCCGSMVGHPNLRRVRWPGGRPFGAGSGWPMALGGAFSMRPEPMILRLAGFCSTGKANRFGSEPCLRGSARACPSGLLVHLTTSEVSRAAIACRREWPCRRFGSAATSMASGGAGRNRKPRVRSDGGWSAACGREPGGPRPSGAAGCPGGWSGESRRPTARGVGWPEPTEAWSTPVGAGGGGWPFFREAGPAEAACSNRGHPSARPTWWCHGTIRTTPDGTAGNGGPPGPIRMRCRRGPSRQASSGKESGAVGGAIDGGLPCLRWSCPTADPP